MFASDAKQPKLKVAALSDIILLTPNVTDFNADDEIEDKPTTDTVVPGSVSLFLPSPKRLPRIRVELISKQNVYIKGVYETVELLRKVVELDTGAQILGPGEHNFAFQFIVPANAAPYDRNSFGRTYQKLIATAPGLGRFGGDLVAEDNLAFVTNHSPTGGVPPGFSMTQETQHTALGPVGVNLFSKYLLVAGFIRLALILPSFAEAVRIEDIKVQLEQTFDLQSHKQPSRTDKKHVIVPLWSAKSDPSTSGVMRNYIAGEELSLSHQFRLPDDNAIRPSTSENSATNIRVSHRLAVCLRFVPLENNPQMETKELKIAIAAILSSCCCLFEALQLPAYSRCDLTKPDFGKGLDLSAIGYCSECLCKIADASKNAVYRVPQEELDRAVRTRQPDSPFLDDEEFKRELERSGSPRRGSPPLPTYGTSSSSAQVP